MKVILMVLMAIVISGCASTVPTIKQMETKDYVCVVYDNGFSDDEAMECFKK